MELRIIVDAPGNTHLIVIDLKQGTSLKDAICARGIAAAHVMPAK